jgi:hypothetical protein
VSKRPGESGTQLDRKEISLADFLWLIFFLTYFLKQQASVRRVGRVLDSDGLALAGIPQGAFPFTRFDESAPDASHDRGSSKIETSYLK